MGLVLRCAYPRRARSTPAPSPSSSCIDPSRSHGLHVSCTRTEPNRSNRLAFLKMVRDASLTHHFSMLSVYGFILPSHQKSATPQLGKHGCQPPPHVPHIAPLHRPGTLEHFLQLALLLELGEAGCTRVQSTNRLAADEDVRQRRLAGALQQLSTHVGADAVK